MASVTARSTAALIERLEETKASTTHGPLHRLSRRVRDDGHDAIRGVFQEDRIGNCERDGAAGELGKRDKAGGHGDKEHRGHRRRLDKQNDERYAFQKLAWKCPVFFCGQDTVPLLEAEDDKENPRHHEAAYCLTRVPGIDFTAEVDGHYAGNTGANHQNHPEIVELRKSLFIRNPWPWVKRGDHKEVDRHGNSSKEDFEGIINRRTRMSNVRTHG